MSTPLRSRKNKNRHRCGDVTRLTSPLVSDANCPTVSPGAELTLDMLDLVLIHRTHLQGTAAAEIQPGASYRRRPWAASPKTTAGIGQPLDRGHWKKTKTHPGPAMQVREIRSALRHAGGVFRPTFHPNDNLDQGPPLRRIFFRSRFDGPNQGKSF